MAATAITMAIAAATAVAAGAEQAQQLKGQAKAMKAQANALEANARQTRLEGSLNEDVQRRHDRQIMSASRAMMGEMGIGDSSTAAGVLAQDAANAEQNALNMRYKSETEANNYIQAAADARFGARQAKKQARRAFYMGLLQGGANAIAAGIQSSSPHDGGKDGAKDGGNKSGFSWLWGSE